MDEFEIVWLRITHRIKPTRPHVEKPKKNNRGSAKYYCTRPIPFSAKSLLQLLKTCFITFPLAVLGSSSGFPSSPMNQTQAGAFYNDGKSPSVSDNKFREGRKTMKHRVKKEYYERTRIYLWIHVSRHQFPKLLATDGWTIRGSRFSDDPCSYNFSVLFIRHSNRSCFSYRRVQCYRILNLNWKEIL